MDPGVPASGEALGHFRLIEKIGEGGMGVVHKAWDTRLERVVALKVITRELLRHDQSRTRLLREARIASSLNHPNIATIHDLEEADGKDIIVMEYVQGPTLRARLRGGPMEVRDVMDVAVAVADALGEAHAQNVVHRDIKPENIILTPRGHPKIMDFGLARLLRPGTRGEGSTGVGRAPTRITSEGAALGTVSYMSPEQAMGKDVDVRTDVFSFGVVLYEMLTHAAPFSGDSDVDILYEILHHEPRPIAELNPDVPADLQFIVSRCTAKDPAARYSSAIRVRDDLKRARISLDVQRAHTLHTLFSISREMTSILSLEPLLERIAALVKSLIAYDMLGIFRADAKSSRLYWLGGSGYDPERARSREYRLDEGLCGRAIRTREVVRVGDVSQDPDYYPPNGQKFASNLVVPLIHGDRVVGVLNMESRQPNFFTNEHATIMATLAGPIAVAMENARLFEEQHRHAQALERLHDIGREVSSILDLDQLLERVGQLTRRMIGHDLFTVFLLDEGAGEFTWRTAQGYDPGFVRERKVRLGEGVISRAAKLREAVIVNDTSADPDYIHPRSADGRPMRSELAVPLVAQDSVLGVLTLESVEPEHFLPEHSRLMTVLASQVAVAVSNAEVYREVQDRVRDRQKEAERIRKRFESYVTPHIAEELFRDPRAKALAGERRPISVLVADIRGFTPLSESLPEEAVVAFLQEFFSVMTHVIFKYEGTVDKFLGDSLMALYGAPVAHDPRYGPSDSQRAVFAGLDMREAFLRLRDKWWGRHAEFGSLELCVGISTGVCLLGNMGSDKRVEYTAIGSVVNQAFSFCREATGGEIRIGERTHSEVHEDVRVEPAEGGSATPAGTTHRVVGLKYLS